MKNKKSLALLLAILTIVFLLLKPLSGILISIGITMIIGLIWVWVNYNRNNTDIIESILSIYFLAINNGKSHDSALRYVLQKQSQISDENKDDILDIIYSASNSFTSNKINEEQLVMLIYQIFRDANGKPPDDVGLEFIAKTKSLYDKWLNKTDGLIHAEIKVESTKPIVHFIEEDYCNYLIERKSILVSSIGEIPESFLRKYCSTPHQVKSFDVNRWLSEVFNQVSLMDGYTLDYIYLHDNEGGEPLVYARHQNLSPLENEEIYFSLFPNSKPEMLIGSEPTHSTVLSYSNKLVFQETPIGYFEYALLIMVINRFYLFWHSNYNDRKYILTDKALNYMIDHKAGDLTDDEEVALKKINPKPMVKINGREAEVTILSYENNIGYSQLSIGLKWPNQVLYFRDNIVIARKATLLY